MLNPLLRNGVIVGHAEAVQIDVALGVGAFETVLLVATDRAADGGQLAANLVLATGLELDGQQVVAIAAAQVFVAELGDLGAGARAFVDGRAVAAGVAELVL